MSSVSQKEKNPTELNQELDALRATNSTLRAYLNHMKMFKKDLASINNNLKQLSQVNTHWIETVKK